jgi:RNA polymerase I-specific transcription initiation factor RRN3
VSSCARPTACRGTTCKKDAVVDCATNLLVTSKAAPASAITTDLLVWGVNATLLSQNIISQMSSSLISVQQASTSFPTSKSSISKHVAKALNFDPQSSDAQLANLCSVLRECREVPMLKQLVSALASHVHEIVRRKHVHLVVCLLESSWYHYDGVFKGVSDVVRTVVTSDNQFCAPVMKVLISLLIPSSRDASFVAPLSVRRVHGLISAVLSAVPTAVAIFIASLRGSWPHKSLPILIRATAVCQALISCTYVPAAFEMVMYLVFDSIVQLDAECNYEDSTSDQLRPDDASELVFEMDEASSKDQDSVEKLDLLMASILNFLCFAYDSSTAGLLSDPNPGSRIFHWDGCICGDVPCCCSGVPPATDLESMFNSIMKAFQSCVLPTHRSRYAQYIIFYAAIRDRSHCEAFLSRLIHTALDASVPSTVRVSASCYIGSFLARSTWMDVRTTCAALKVLSDWAILYIEPFKAASEHHLDATLHLPFHGVIQALVYTLCYIITHNGVCQFAASELQIMSIIRSPLQPLQVIFRPIVKEFGRLACAASLIEPSDLLIACQAPVHPSFSDSHFPFEPYTLPATLHFFEANFRCWGDLIPDSDASASAGTSFTESYSSPGLRPAWAPSQQV